MNGSIKREIEAPAKAWLSLEEAAAFLGYTEGEWEERLAIIDSGIIRGDPVNLKGKLQWSRDEVVGLSLLRKRIDAEFLRLKKKKHDEAKGRRPQKPAQNDEDTKLG